MKHTKKMVLIPQIEYMTLLSMLKGADPLATERAQADVQLQQALHDPGLGEEQRARRYEKLQRKRRHLAKVIEQRPQRVVIEQLEQPSTSVPPYLGVDSGGETKLQQPEVYDTAVDEFASTTPAPPEVTPRKGRRAKTKALEHVKQLQRKTTSPFQAIIASDRAAELEKYVSDNRDKFRIAQDGSFESRVGGKLMSGTNYKDVLAYLTGQAQSPKKGFTFLYERLIKDPHIKGMLKKQEKSDKKKKPKKSSSTTHPSSNTAKTSGTTSSSTYTSSAEQSGSGKKRKKRLVFAKASPKLLIKGRRQKNKFKPQLWAKI